MPLTDVAIVGGGISGLAAAYELARRGVPFELFERAPRLGGVITTEAVDGYVIDAGPDALLTQKPAAISLCGELGLREELQPQQARRTFVVRGGTLRELPEASVLGFPTAWRPFVASRAFSWRGKLRMAAELLVRSRSSAVDESIASFIGRRFGQEAVDYLAEPLLAGVHGGDPARLSMAASFPRFLALEASAGSVIAGLRRLPRPAGSGAPRTPFVAPASGMGALTRALEAVLPSRSLHTGCGVETIESSHGDYVLHLSGGRTLKSHAVLFATPPAVTSRLAREIDGDLSALCGRIHSTSAVTVALGYQRSAIRHPLDGTGFVAPRREGLDIRAASWVSSKWAGRAPAGHVLLRAYVGGAADPSAIDRSDADLFDIVERDLGRVLNIVGEPQLGRIYRWRNATPQLEVGHGELMNSIDARLCEQPGLFVSAAGFRGTGIADCVADARLQAAFAAEAVTPALTA